MKTRRTILCIPHTHTISHLSRPLLVAKELRHRGYEVVFAGESPKVKFIQREDFKVLPLHEPDPVVLFGNIRKGKLRFLSDSEIERMIEADIPEYFPAKNVPDNYHYIGLLTLKSNIPPPSWWPPERGERPLVYITMGTTGIGDFFQRVYDLFKRSDMTVVITTGGQVPEMRTLAGKIYVEDFIDGDLMMEACDLVVCHGGNGTIYQALLHGKPIIGIPTIPDQGFNMRRVEAVGVGKSLTWKEFNADPKVLLDVIDAVLATPYFTEKSHRMQDTLKKYQGEKIGADLIEGYMVKQGDVKGHPVFQS